MNILKTLSALVIFVALTSCVTKPPKTEPEAAHPNMITEFKRVQKDIRKKNTGKALIRLQKIIAQNPKSTLADDAHMMMGDLYLEKKDYEQAYKAFMGVINGPTYSPMESVARIKAAQALSELGRHEEVMEITDKALDDKRLSPVEITKIHKIRLTALRGLNRKMDLLKSYVSLSENTADPIEKQEFRIQATNIVESNLSEEELEKVARRRSFTFVRGTALFRLGVSLFERGEFRRARVYFSKVVEVSPDSDLAERSSALISQLDSREKVAPMTIGAILPLSGKMSEFGYRALKGIQLGLGIFGKRRSNYKLAVIDSEGSPAAAQRAVERLVVEDNVIAIVGSLSSKTASAVAAKSQEFGVPSLALSQKAGLTEVGNYVFRNALTTEMQVQHLVQTAMEKQGKKRFAILYPDDNYGKECAGLFWQEVEARGGEIRAAQSYDAKETDFRKHIQRLVGTYYKKDRNDEYQLRLAEWKESQPYKSARKKPPKDLLPPVIDFDALFIPDGTKSIGQISPMLAYTEVSNVTLMGTNLWNTRSLARRAGQFLNEPIFVDSFLAQDPIFRNSVFSKKFSRAYKTQPDNISLQAYDAALILRTIIDSGETTRDGVKDKLVTLSDFSGALGKLSIGESREVNRPVTTLTLRDGQIVPLAQ